MYLWGVSTRNIEEIMEPLCGFSVSKSQVSELAGRLDHDLNIWRTRPLKEVFAATTKEEAKNRLGKVGEFLKRRKKDNVWIWLEESVEETLAVLDLPIEHRKKMKSTNMLERFNQELKRRSRVVRIFPNEQSCLRLLTALCQETSESWGNRNYLKEIS